MNGDSKEYLSAAQLACINAMISKLKLQAQKNDMVSGFTNGRTSSRAKMYKGEATAFIQHLKSLDPDEVKCNEVRKAMISIGHEMHWHKSDTKHIDMKRLDNWCKKYGQYKKALNSHTLPQLQKLLQQFKQVYISYINGL